MAAISESEFERWLRFGLGRTILLLRQGLDGSRFRPQIRRAFRDRWVFNPQLEDWNPKYYEEVANLAGFGHEAKQWLEDPPLEESSADVVKEEPEGVAVAVRALRQYSDSPHPGGHEPLLAIARNEHSPVRVRFAAYRALGAIQHPAVRAHALAGRDLDAADRKHRVWLLRQNYVHGDGFRFARWIQREHDLDVLHLLGFDLFGVFVKNTPDFEAEQAALLALYEFGPCSHCRAKAVERLFTLNRWPEEIVEECLFDANEEIRAITRRRQAVRPGPA